MLKPARTNRYLLEPVAAAAADSSGSAVVARKAVEGKNQEGNKAKPRPRQRLTTEQQRKILRKVHAKWKLHRGRQFVTTWHKSEEDLPMRREMIKHIVKLLRLRRTDAGA